MKNIIIVDPFDKVMNGEIAGSVTAIPMPCRECKMVCFKANNDNVGNVYIGGGSNVTITDGSTDETTGFRLASDESTPWLSIPNLDKLWRICDYAGDNLTYIALG